MNTLRIFTIPNRPYKYSMCRLYKYPLHIYVTSLFIANNIVQIRTIHTKNFSFKRKEGFIKKKKKQISRNSPPLTTIPYAAQTPSEKNRYPIRASTKTLAIIKN